MTYHGDAHIFQSILTGKGNLYKSENIVEYWKSMRFKSEMTYVSHGRSNRH